MNKDPFKSLLKSYKLAKASNKEDAKKSTFEALVHFMSAEFNDLRKAYSNEWLSEEDMSKLLASELSYKTAALTPSLFAEHDCLDKKNEGKKAFYQLVGNKPVYKLSIFEAYTEATRRTKEYQAKSHLKAKNTIDSALKTLKSILPILKENGYKISKPVVNEKALECVKYLRSTGRYNDLADPEVEYVEI